MTNSPSFEPEIPGEKGGVPSQEPASGSATAGSRWCRASWEWSCFSAQSPCSTTTLPVTEQGAQPDELHKQVQQLTQQVAELEKEQAMPALVLNRYRNSIGYIYGVYQVGFANQPAAIRARVSGTGFLVGDGLLATNRHVAEPWYGDSEAEDLIHRGATAMLESLVIFFPGSPTPVSSNPGHSFLHR
jgi:S1-C subfamily serine protease